MTATTELLANGNYQTIEKKESLLQMNGISAKTVEEHWKLYEGYCNKWKEIDGLLKDADLSTANQIWSQWRALKTDLSFAIGGVKNHQLYFGHLGGDGSAPTGWIGQQIDRQWGSYDNFKRDLKATGMGGRGWAWLAWDWQTMQLGTYIGDAQNTFPIWNATPLVALDVYEHAYFMDFGTNRAAYIDAFFENLDWNHVQELVEGMQMDKFNN